MNHEEARDLPKSPYAELPPEAFWSSGVCNRATLDPGLLYTPTFRVSRRTRFSTAGSCFAQHVGRALQNAQLNLVDTEPLPGRVPDIEANRFGYRLYSARYGNIYTMRQLLQLSQEAFGEIPQRNAAWERDGRFFDAFRPGVEPHGLSSAEEVYSHRKSHLTAVRRAIEETDVFIFTLGLTECWISRKDGTVYPTCPGTIAGQFDPALYKFHNFTYPEVMADFISFRDRLLNVNKKIRILLTVSPVPLTATASGVHIEVANSYSKSVLRSVTNDAAQLKNVAYFPSYEVITSQNSRGAYFAPNQRSISQEGVDAAMRMFLTAHGLQRDSRRIIANRAKRREEEAKDRGSFSENQICEDVLLDMFSQ